MPSLTGKQRMLNAYRGIFSDRVAIAPEFWYYYPAKVLGVDMIEFQREVPFHLALKTTFEKYGCEGWGVVFIGGASRDMEVHSQERWISESTLEVRTRFQTSRGTLTASQRFDRVEPSWSVERPIKDPVRDLPAFEIINLTDPASIDVPAITRAWNEVGESYLLEGWLGVPFFDFYATGREGGLEAAIYDFYEQESMFEALRERYQDWLVARAEALCRKTPLESLCIGCSWSCNSLIGPDLWRRWDKPVIRAVAEAVHRQGRLLHIHFHGRCLETVADFAEIGIDCVCPFERPPGGDVDGLDGLRQVERLLAGRTAMNGNIHTVETLIRGSPEDVRREVREVLEAFRGNPRVILGTGDQVGLETPEENIRAFIEEGKKAGTWSATAP